MYVLTIQLNGCIVKEARVAEYKCYYYSLASGEKPVEDFISSLNEKRKGKFKYVKGLLEVSGHRLKRPYSKYLGRSIFELRFEGVEGYVRVLYFFLRQDAVVFINGFIKKSNKIPKNEIDLATRRRKSCLQLKLEGENK
jgi:phage-related protein